MEFKFPKNLPFDGNFHQKNPLNFLKLLFLEDKIFLQFSFQVLSFKIGKLQKRKTIMLKIQSNNNFFYLF